MPTQWLENKWRSHDIETLSILLALKHWSYCCHALSHWQWSKMAWFSENVISYFKIVTAGNVTKWLIFSTMILSSTYKIIWTEWSLIDKGNLQQNRLFAWSVYNSYCRIPELWFGSWNMFIVRRAGLLWWQQDFEWLWSVPLSSASLY